ncbi:RDD family protein [Desulfuromonas sp. TF]|uniref:RDD family protein n=1 Tax=Desulfuromonas sp. TF TaxID=1232410 RepID=UPI0003F9434B
MTITCPHCGFFRDVDSDRIPSRATRASCPRCRKSFPLPRGMVAAPVFGPAEPELQSEAEEVPHPSPTTLPKAGFWIRMIAAIVDWVLVTAVEVTLGLLLGLATARFDGGLNGSGQSMISIVIWLFGTVLTVAYYVFFTGYCGQTPGKMALRIKVIRTNGMEIGYGKAALREVLGKFVSVILLGIGYLMVAFDLQKQGLHDKIADTYVIKL